MATTMTTPRTAITDWPAAKVGTGPALNKKEAAQRLGRSLSAVEAIIRRTRLGTARHAWPEPDGYAIHPGSEKAVMVPYHYERTIIAFGRSAGILNNKNESIPSKGKARSGGGDVAMFAASDLARK